MNIYLSPSWLLTDENSEAAKEIPVLINLGSWKAYQHGDMIGAYSAPQVVSLAVEAKGENNFMPEEIHFISRFKEGHHGSQWVRSAMMGNMRKLTYRALEFLGKSNLQRAISGLRPQRIFPDSIFHWPLDRHFHRGWGHCCKYYEQKKKHLDMEMEFVNRS